MQWLFAKLTYLQFLIKFYYENLAMNAIKDIHLNRSETPCDITIKKFRKW